jgi:flavin reductase (DIM6/NTAB) family NADH-FMN oxidoreductase RutF
MRVPIALDESLRLIVPGVCGLVTTFYRGRFNVTTVSWMAPAGREPPLVVLAIHPSTLCYDMIKRSGEFTINIPNQDVINQVVSCGRMSGNDVDKFERTGLEMVEPKAVQAPLISQCIGHLECAVVNKYEPGDHALIIGQVAYAWADDDAFDGFWKMEGTELKPLHHLGGVWFGVIEERVDATPPDVKSALEKRQAKA